MDDEWWLPALGEVVDGCDVIFAGAVPAAWNDPMEHLRAAGAERFMVIATEGHGVGAGPDVPTAVVEPSPDLTMMQRIRFGIRTIAAPPPPVLDALTEFDPDRSAIVVGTFLNEAPELDGRPVLSHRRPEWLALEDKTVVDDFWDRAGVPRLPSQVVAIDEAPTAARSVDRGAGTVWAADARDGFHGGASLTRWVADAASEARALDDLRPACELVRIMPFIDGVACSIHGIVLPDGAAVLRPVELVTLRRGYDLVYAGAATYWDPPWAVREQMRDIARRTAAALVTEVDYRGTFTVDGVVEDGTFWPTELNPRFGAGIMAIARAGGNVPIVLLHDLAVAGRSIGCSATEFEEFLISHADEHRGGGTWTTTSPDTTPVTRDAHFDGAAWSWDGSPSGSVIGGAGFVRCVFAADRTPVGPSVASRAAAFWRFADAELATGIGPLTPAPHGDQR